MLVLVIKNAEFEIFNKDGSLNKVNNKTIEVKKFPILIGRKPDADLPSIVFSQSPSVSASHCYLFNTDKEGICVLDNSRNGIVIIRNRRVISVKKQVNTSLKDGDSLELPDVSIHVFIYDLANKKQSSNISSTDDIVEKNLKLMNSSSNGGMLDLLSHESMGGNAGTYKNLLCLVANFFFDENTGEIIYFENIQAVPENICNAYSGGFFRLVIDLNASWKYVIIKFKADCANALAKTVMERTVSEYNKRFGFKI